MALHNFMRLTLACHSEEESKYLRACQNHTKKTWIFQAPEAPAPAAPAMKKLLFCWMRKDAGKDADAGSVDATWRISSSLLRMCARQDCFVFERPQVVFYCNFSSSRHVSKRHFSRRCAHSYIGALCLVTRRKNVGEYRTQNFFFN